MDGPEDVDLDELEAYCTFGAERVYLLVAIARSKENEGVDGPTPTLREVVEERGDLDPAIRRLDGAVSRFEATYRLYLSANARNATTAFFELRRNTDEWLEMRLHGNREVLGKFRRVDREFHSVLQREGCRDDRNLLFDLDDAPAAEATAFREALAAHTEVLFERETPNGYHLVTAPFDHDRLETDTEYERKTDGLVFLSYLGV